MLAAIPMGISLFLSFWVPKGITGSLLMIYIITVAVLWGVMNTFGGTINNVVVVMTPNLKERDTVISFRGIVSAVGNSASLVIIVVLNLIFKDNQALQYIICAAMSGVLGVLTMLFGASNLLPSMFQADVLEDIELKTGKRLDSSLPFVIGVFTMISGSIAGALSPLILYGDNSICGYIQGIEDGTMQSLKTKIWMLFFYTIFHGIMMFLAGVPFFFYKLTGKTKEDIHNQLIEKRKQYNNEN